MTDKRQLASTWIMAQKIGIDKPGYDKCGWAVYELINMANDSPEDLWLTILEILELDSTEEIIKAVGAGPLEDLMIYFDKDYINKIEEQALRSSSFKLALQNVWLDENDTPLYKRFYEIAGINPPLFRSCD